MTGDWKGFSYDAIQREARQLYDEYNLTCIRIAPVQVQDSLEYWIAVATWHRAKSFSAMVEKTPVGSTRWR
jgi:hypothetical protein